MEEEKAAGEGDALPARGDHCALRPVRMGPDPGVPLGQDGVEAKRADSGEFMVQIPSATTILDPAKVQRAQSGDQVKSAKRSAKPDEDKAQMKRAPQRAFVRAAAAAGVEAKQ